MLSLPPRPAGGRPAGPPAPPARPGHPLPADAPARPVRLDRLAAWAEELAEPERDGGADAPTVVAAAPR